MWRIKKVGVAFLLLHPPRTGSWGSGDGSLQMKKKKKTKKGPSPFVSQQNAQTHRGGIFDEGKISLGSMFCFEIDEKGGLTLLAALVYAQQTNKQTKTLN